MKTLSQNTSGLTLVELLVAASVFAIVVVIALDLLINFMSASVDLTKQTQFQEEATFAIEEMSYRIHNSHIAYDNYNNGICRTVSLPLVHPKNDALCMTDTVGQDWFIELDAHTNPNFAGAENMYIKDDFGNAPLFSDDIVVSKFEVYVYPSNDPNDIVNGLNNQEGVMIVFTLESPDEPEIGQLHYQTFISTRVYER